MASENFRRQSSGMVAWISAPIVCAEDEGKAEDEGGKAEDEGVKADDECAQADDEDVKDEGKAEDEGVKAEDEGVKASARTPRAIKEELLQSSSWQFDSNTGEWSRTIFRSAASSTWPSRQVLFDAGILQVSASAQAEAFQLDMALQASMFDADAHDGFDVQTPSTLRPGEQASSSTLRPTLPPMSVGGMSMREQWIADFGSSERQHKRRNKMPLDLSNMD